jgi:hypothetical protein
MPLAPSAHGELFGEDGEGRAQGVAATHLGDCSPMVSDESDFTSAVSYRCLITDKRLALFPPYPHGGIELEVIDG